MKEILTFTSNNKVNTCYGNLWFDLEIPPKAIVQLVHGMTENSERYDDLAKFLVSKGFVVCAEDHLGHGKTGDASQSFGYFGPYDGLSTVVDDVHSFSLLVREKYPNLPFFLLGHSMGSFIAEEYAARYGKELAGAIFSGTGGPNPALGVGLTLCKIACKLKGDKNYSKLISGLMFGNYLKKIENPRTVKDWLTHDEKVIDDYLANPYCMFNFTLGGQRDLMLLLKRVTSPEWPKRLPKDLPVYYYAGDEDPVGNYGEGVKEMARRVEEAGVKDVTLKLYPGDRHEVHNELDKDVCYADLDAWLSSHIQ